MWKISRTVYLIVLIPYLAIGIYLLYLGFTTSPSLTADSHFLKNSFYFEGISCIIIPLILIAGILLYKKRIANEEIDRAPNSIKGEAEILDMEETEIHVNELPQIKFLLRVTLPGRSPYKIEHRKIMSTFILNSLNIGSKLPVFVDPDNPEKILLGYYLYFQ